MTWKLKLYADIKIRKDNWYAYYVRLWYENLFETQYKKITLVHTTQHLGSYL